MNVTGLTITALALVLSSTSCASDGTADLAGAPTPRPPSESSGAEPADGLRDTSFVSISVTTNGQDRPLIQGSKITLTFQDDVVEGEGARPSPNDPRSPYGIYWNSGCNTTSGNLVVQRDRLVIEPIASTQIGCGLARDRQDDWIREFFAAGPRWRYQDELLVLEANGTVMRLLKYS